MDKPEGKWKCRACGAVWDGNQLYDDPAWSIKQWTCGNLLCGGVCDRVGVERVIPSSNWTMHLADAIEESVDGDIIVVASEDAKELGQRAQRRMCPGKKITFQVERRRPEDVYPY